MKNTESHLWLWLEKMTARSGGIKSTILQRNVIFPFRLLLSVALEDSAPGARISIDMQLLLSP